MASITISHTTRSYPDLPYEAMARAILGARYELSLVFVGADRAQRINQEQRERSYVPDVLSFPLAEGTGEIYLCLPKARADAPQYEHTPDGHVGFLLIHGMLHLKGHEHGATMEKAERTFCRKFQIT